ncbi:DUF3011 domain-containing protein [Luteimonas cucumeris]|uniref:DUF3011 domain-containing protein n=1 Tax=Luteimonas cucumeris TaxID=985012 RepID=UPI001F557350|nr:DUF3011 domain-containing protein [Luteimonas cucumeris]
MNRLFLLAATALIAGAPLASHAQAAISMFNGTCPGGLEIHADEGGPVYVNGRETRLQRFNDKYIEARDAGSSVTLSITRSPDDSLAVSYTGKGGANGVCSIANSSSSEPASTNGSPDPEVTCESRGQGQNECDMDTRGDIRLVRQLSKTPCVQGQNWGLYHHSVWVKDGCRAVFRNMSGGGHPSHHSSAAIGPGAELLGACNTRAGDSGALITRVPVNEDVTELIVDYPDGRYLSWHATTAWCCR